ncbi:hypothetical protein MPH_07780 [Macrophomina phaseolina MS6]|uniref:Uncharacterized protein n=2 Tax=Macrophomina phaseolina TaxID=35725 RepID=K2RQR6_MACPH|nr:hypothetical protein MPH_07780 [Macrophomina phaseolina MS6]KAH7063199.1 hypothetical protein B0J12DRAFT_641779 [Macrophomina phaseolina]
MAPLPHLLSALLRRAASPDSIVDATSASHMQGTMHQLARRSSQSPGFGKGAKPASDFNNQGFLALFALIGAGMVLGSIWFFFWAKNGGFKWRKGDWDDYKSTVLRRKGPDGRTLSNATKSTKLGGGSVVHGGSYGAPTSVGYTDSSSMVEEKEEQQRRAGEGIRGGGGRRTKRRKDKDPELAEYRHEKAARVGGLNRQHDGTHFDYSNTEPSELGSELSQRPLVKDGNNKKAAKKEAEAREKELRKAQKEAAKIQKAKLAENKKREKAKAKEMKKAKGKSDRSYSPAKAEPDSPERRTNRRYADEMTEVTEATTSYTEGYTETEVYTDVYTNNDSYYSSYRPHAEANITRPTPAARNYDSPSPRHSSRRSHSHSRQSSPRKQSHSRRQSRSRRDLGDESDTGTKVYTHHIPGLSSGPAAPTIVPDESISQVGAPGRRGRNVMDGYRRSGVRSRRDSLSDSD